MFDSEDAPGTTRTCDLLVRSPVGTSSANSHLATSTNIFNELQPPVSAPIYAEIGLFPARIVTRLSQATSLRSRSYESCPRLAYLLPFDAIYKHLQRFAAASRVQLLTSFLPIWHLVRSKAYYKFVIHAQIIMVFHGLQEAAGSNSAIPIY